MTIIPHLQAPPELSPEGEPLGFAYAPMIGMITDVSEIEACVIMRTLQITMKLMATELNKLGPRSAPVRFVPYTHPDRKDRN